MFGRKDKMPPEEVKNPTEKNLKARKIIVGVIVGLAVLSFVFLVTYIYMPKA